MSITKAASAAWKKAIGRIGAIVTAVGGTLLSLDIAGQGDTLKQMANEYLGQKGAQKVGAFLFAAAFARFLWTAYKNNQHREIIELLQARVDALQAQQKVQPSQQPAGPSQETAPPSLKVI